MPLQKIVLRPGIVRDTSNYSNEGGWFECDKIRFFSGYPQKIGGWIKTAPSTFIGTCRQMLNWVTSFTDNFLALGTNKKVYIEVGSTYYDITPLRITLISGGTLSPLPVTGSTDNCIETTNGSTTVTINVTAHGCETGAYVTISGVTGDVGGVPDAEINIEHEVTRVDANIFTITVTTAATSTVAAGGGTSIDIACQINPGFALTTAGYGWGTGGWGDDGWGLSSSQPIYLPQRDWFFDNFDNDLVMNIRAEVNAAAKAVGGPIYYWERGSAVNPSTVLGTRAVLLSSVTLGGVAASDVPTSAHQILVSQNDKHLLAFGCQPYAGAADDFDPLLIRWASQDQPNDWTPRSTNSAGFLRVSRGSKIVKAIPTRQEIIVLTDTHVYNLQFLATTDVFGLQELADNISVMGPRGSITANNVLYWMGKDKFYMYDGRVQTLPCTIRDYIFKDINFLQADQVICGTNEGFNEIWWFYPSQDSNWVDRYAIFNYLEGVWYYGNLTRTAWLDVASRDFPIAAYTPENQDPGVLYTHEVAIDDDGAPISSFIQSSDFDIGDGDSFMLTKRIIPDINFDQSTSAAPTVTLGIRGRDFPGSSYTNNALNAKPVIENPVGVYTNQIFIRARGRQMAIRISSNDLGVQWQLGSPRIDARTDGKR
jgi:hypothetical protein